MKIEYFLFLDKKMVSSCELQKAPWAVTPEKRQQKCPSNPPFTLSSIWLTQKLDKRKGFLVLFLGQLYILWPEQQRTEAWTLAALQRCFALKQFSNRGYPRFRESPPLSTNFNSMAVSIIHCIFHVCVPLIPFTMPLGSDTSSQLSL